MRLIELTFYLLLTVVPLLLTPWNFELFEFNKMLAVYAGTAVIAAGWLIEMVRQRRRLFKPTPLDLPLGLFLLSQILSTVFSVEPHTSVWGYYSRFHGGLLSTVSYLVLFWAYSTFMRDKTKKVINVILSAGLVVALYGIAERFGVDKHIWIQDVVNRVFSTLGQPNWLAAYLIMLIPLAAAEYRFWRLIPVYLAALYFTHSRSGFISFGATALIYAGARFRRFLPLVILAGGGGLFLGYRFVIAELNPPPGGPAISQGGSTSAEIRRVVWRGAIEIGKHYPLFGSGVETFAYAYYNFRPAEHNLLSEWDFLYNKAHNEFLNFFATTGTVGLGSYLLLILWTGVFLVRQKRPDLLAGYLGACVSNFFGFAVVPVALLFFLFPALALPDDDESKAAHQPVNNWQAIGITFIILITFYILLFIIKLWRADYLFNLGRNQVKAKLLTQGWQNLSRAVALAPKEPVFRNDLAEAEAQLAYAYASPSADMARQLTEQAVKDADLVVAQNPVHLNFWRSRVKIFLLLAELNPDYYNQALRSLEQAISLAPTDAKLIYNLGLLLNQLGQTGQAEQVLVQTVSLKPNYEAARMSLAELYRQTDRPALARGQFEYILKFLNPQNQAALDSLAGLE